MQSTWTNYAWYCTLSSYSSRFFSFSLSSLIYLYSSEHFLSKLEMLYMNTFGSGRDKLDCELKLLSAHMVELKSLIFLLEITSTDVLAFQLSISARRRFNSSLKVVKQLSFSFDSLPFFSYYKISRARKVSIYFTSCNSLWRWYSCPSLKLHYREKFFFINSSISVSFWCRQAFNLEILSSASAFCSARSLYSPLSLAWWPPIMLRSYCSSARSWSRASWSSWSSWSLLSQSMCFIAT
jgi:hypothetical protein